MLVFGRAILIMLWLLMAAAGRWAVALEGDGGRRRDTSLPTTEEVFAKLGERARQLGGLRCTLRVEHSMTGTQGMTWRLEFLAPGHLRCELAPAPFWGGMQLMLAPEVSVVTPRERWTYVVRRDEVATGPCDETGGIGWGAQPWSGGERVLAAQLAPQAFYADYSVCRVSPDRLSGKRCVLVLLARKGLAANRLWIDPERWAILRLELKPLWQSSPTVQHHERGVALLPGLEEGKRWLEQARAQRARP